MKKLTFDFTKNDKGKTVVNLAHEYRPFPDDEDIVVHCRYIPAGKFMGYADMRTGSYDMQELFIKQVDRIDGVVVEDPKGEKLDVSFPEAFVGLTGEFPTALVTRTVTHLLTGENLTEAEVKN